MNLIVNFIPDTINRKQALDGGLTDVREQKFLEAFSNIVNKIVFRPFTNCSLSSTPELDYLSNSPVDTVFLPHDGNIKICSVGSSAIEVEMVVSAQCISKHMLPGRREMFEDKVKNLLSSVIQKELGDNVYKIEKIFP